MESRDQVYCGCFVPCDPPLVNAVLDDVRRRSVPWFVRGRNARRARCEAGLRRMELRSDQPSFAVNLE